MNKNLEKTSAPWKAIANMWNTYFTQPSRVSREESKKYKEWLLKYADSSKKILLLGVTPEIRESLAELKYDVTCIDINSEMISAMNSALKIKNSKEKIINEDWLNNSLLDNSFDIVIGDAVLPNVAWGNRDKLLLEIKRILKPNGIFINRAFFVPRKKRFKSVNELLEKFSIKKPDYQSALELALELQIIAYNPKDHLGTFSGPRDILKKIREKNGFEFESDSLNKILEMVWSFWCVKFVEKEYTYEYQDEEEREYKKYFYIIESYQAKDNSYSDITPMYILRLK